MNTERERRIDPLADGLLIRIGHRENIEQKGRRYLIEGRLRVLVVRPGLVVATARGTERTHRIRYEYDAWSCSCEARSRCSHLVAAQLVAGDAGDAA
jgi:hypothetical protein